jgi:hypothetical protein
MSECKRVIKISEMQSFQILLRARLEDWPFPVWRDILIRSEATFFDLHIKLQAAFVWYDDHAFIFDLGRRQKGEGGVGDWEKGIRSYVSPGLWEENRQPGEIESIVSLQNEKWDPGQSFSYTYDMGDSIEINLRVLSLGPVDGITLPPPRRARVVKLKGFSPEQYAYRRDEQRYSAKVRALARLAKPILVSASAKEEEEILAEWSDYYNRRYVNTEGLPTRRELLRFYRTHDTSEKMLAFYKKAG